MVRGGVYGFLIRHFVAIAGALALLSYAAIYSRQGSGAHSLGRVRYYVYLPSWFLHGDTTLDGVAHPPRRRVSGVHSDQTLAGTNRWVNPIRWTGF